MGSGMQVHSAGGYSELSRKQLIWTVIGLQVTLLLAALDQTIVSTAMPRIVSDLNGFDRYAWVTTAYLLTSTASLPVVGKLSDMYGRKSMLILSSLAFIVSSALCGISGFVPLPFADGMTQLIIFRGLQGIAGGAIMSLVFTVVGDLFAPADRGKYQGLFAGVFALASVLGPAAGGWLTDSLSWRWVFYINLPVGAIALSILQFAFPSIRARQHKRTLDWLGVTLLVGWVVPLLLALTWAPRSGLTSPAVLTALALTALMFAGWLISESKSNDPIVPLYILRNRTIAISSVSLLLISVAMFGAILFVPLFFQSVLEASATESGWWLTPMMLMIATVSVLSGQIVYRTGKYRALVLIGLALVTLGMFLLSGIDQYTSAWNVIGITLLMGAGLGLLMPIYTLISQNSGPPHLLGTVTAVTQFFRSIGGTLGAAIFNSILLVRYHAFLDNSLPANLSPEVISIFGNPLQLNRISDQLKASLSGLPDGAELAIKLVDHVKYALVHALDTIFFAAALIVLLSFFLNLLLKEEPLRRKPHNVPAAPADPEVVLDPI